MKRFFLVLTILTFACASVQAQSILERLKQKGREVIENVTTGNQNAESAGSEGEEAAASPASWTCPDCGHEGNTGKFCEECGAKNPGAATSWDCPECGHKGNTGKFCEECGAKQPAAGGAAAAPKKQVSTAYAKSDFVPGDEIFFEDTFENEQLGEFPSRWDLIDGYAEVGSVDGRKVISFTDEGYGEVQPLMNDEKHFLPDVFTLEFDIYLESEEGEEFNDNEWNLIFGNPDLPNWNGRVLWVDLWFRPWDGNANMRWTAQKPNGGDDVTGDKVFNVDDPDSPLKGNAWNHFAFSFNKRAFKGYVNGMRVINIPNAKVPSHFWFQHSGVYKYANISNVRLAKGAVPLYDRLASDGKIITYAITFDTGKATLKPESAVEINRITDLMKKDASLKFEVQGHCDSTGSDAVNDPLSQKRAEAIVAALVENGIAAERLTAVGKGSHSPIADNSTDEGRAKNRRVEFVKK
ncbi:MAG: OmpA family protein [Bacteroidales bacterium]|nr:OmpA family protein [Bacteroidales bacterium]